MNPSLPCLYINPQFDILFYWFDNNKIMEFYLKLGVELNDESDDDLYEKAGLKIKQVITCSLIGFEILTYDDDGDEVCLKIKYMNDLGLNTTDEVLSYLRFNYEDDGAWRENNDHEIDLCLLDISLSK